MNNTMGDTLQILFYASDMVFDFWPFLIFAPLGWKKGSLQNNLLYIWVILLVLRILAFFSAEPIPSFLIPDPLNTVLFGISGVILIVLLVGLRRHKRDKLLQKAADVTQINHLLDVSPTEFEEMIVELYRAAGHQAKRTGSIGDNGIDVVVQAKNGEKWVVQCKRWRKSIGEPIVRDFYGAMQHAKADKGTLITTSYFTRPAQAWAKGKPITLYDGEQLLVAWKKLQRQKMKATTQAKLGQ